jgi:hypothetical protein
MSNFAEMIVCNTTYHIDCSVSGEFLDWIKDTYLPQALDGGMVSLPRLMRMMGHNEGGACFALQFEAPTLGQLQRWNQAVGKRLHQQLTERFGSKVAGFTTFMENIEI